MSAKVKNKKMGFVPISIDSYVTIHLKSNPTEDEKELRKRLKAALTDYKNGVKCACKNDIWVIGSAAVGNSCFSCITGEPFPDEDYEIEQAIRKEDRSMLGEHIDQMDPTKIAGFFNDDGYQINTDLIKKPSLCLICKKENNPDEEVLCKMTRYDQIDDEFVCFAFVKVD